METYLKSPAGELLSEMSYSPNNCISTKSHPVMHDDFMVFVMESVFPLVFLPYFCPQKHLLKSLAAERRQEGERAGILGVGAMTPTTFTMKECYYSIPLP